MEYRELSILIGPSPILVNRISNSDVQKKNFILRNEEPVSDKKNQDGYFDGKMNQVELQGFVFDSGGILRLRNVSGNLVLQYSMARKKMTVQKEK